MQLTAPFEFRCYEASNFELYFFWRFSQIPNAEIIAPVDFNAVAKLLCSSLELLSTYDNTQDRYTCPYVKVYIDEVSKSIVYFSEFQNVTYAQKKNSQSYSGGMIAQCLILHTGHNNSIRLIQEIQEQRVTYKKTGTGHIHFLTHCNNCFDFRRVELNPVNVDLELNYGKEFLTVDRVLTDFIVSDKPGLVLLYGDAGTGKTFYIKSLINKTDKMIVYIPASLINDLSRPEFVSFLLNHKNILFIIEDAEEIVTSRNDIRNSSAVSNLLNITDGLIGDAIKIQAICTFNTKIENIDSALLRKGRLIVEHKFKKLSIDNAQKLLDNLKIEHKATEPMTLAEIYNLKVNNFHKKEERGPVGFQIP